MEWFKNLRGLGLIFCVTFLFITAILKSLAMHRDMQSNKDIDNIDIEHNCFPLNNSIQN